MVILNAIVTNDDWVIFVWFLIMAVFALLGLMLFFRLMKFLKLKIQLMERELNG